MTRSTKLAPKKEGNCNVVATWPHHVILLVISSNNIPLSLPIALTYCFDGSSFWYTKPHSSIIGNQLPTLHCWEALPAAIPFVRKHSHCHSTIFPFVGKQPSLIWFYWGTRSLLIALQLRANNLVIIQIKLSRVNSFIQNLRPLEPPCGWWKYGLLDAISTALWYLIAPVAAM